MGKSEPLRHDIPMKKFSKWLVQSSVDPKSVSLTVKGALLGILPLLIFIAQAVNLNWSQEFIVEIIEQLSGIIAVSLTLFGLIRKIALTIKK